MPYDSMHYQVYKLTFTDASHNYNTALLQFQLCLLLKDITEHYCALYKAKDRLLNRTEEDRQEGKRDVKTSRTGRSALRMLHMPRDSQHIPDMFNLFTNRQERMCVKVGAQKRTQIVIMLPDCTGEALNLCSEELQHEMSQFEQNLVL